MGNGGTLLLTGATSGLGLEVAKLLAGSADWTVVALARSRERGETLREMLGDPGNFRYLAGDQSDLGEIRKAAARVRALLAAQDIPPLRGIVLNAGIQTGSTDSATVDGFELTFGTNLAGPHLLLALLSPELVGPARVLWLGSGTHYGKFRRSYGMVPRPRWEHPEALARPRAGDGIRAYSTSKLGTLYLVHELARRAPEFVEVSCYDPGMMPGTGLARDRGAIERFGWKYLLPALRAVPGVSTSRRSAVQLAALATGASSIPAAELRGAYIEIDHPVRSSAESYDEQRELELFDYLDTVTGSHGDETAPWWTKRPS
ncbi:SDR family NAD(P)-dependent oxidoreductase [Nocardia yamanashiensis]|uniref:SDR family NAD(P)-dependent oxidoreductase n=1 Tax=Nocardia yamanashiensis TaxID=209247 RepID=UPI001E42AA0C|nr:SDR family NAD(P)-dependent oxidoreductase [Nocardia yamanashiensis]UGT42386.1 SDR family NAD(P)-dependent oxidoreductase [Nocardia yamanashiensis]